MIEQGKNAHDNDNPDGYFCPDFYRHGTLLARFVQIPSTHVLRRICQVIIKVRNALVLPKWTHLKLWNPAPSSEKPRNCMTLAEFILAYLGHLSAVGDLVKIGDVTFEVVDIDGKRIDRVLISRQK